jgi:hypothetical protein
VKACKLLHIAFIAEYDAAVKRSYENTVTSLKSTITQEFAGISRSPAGLQAAVRVVRNILTMAEEHVQGWSVTEILRDSYLQPLRDHGDMLWARLVSLESYLPLTSLHTDSLLSAMSST